MDVEDEYPEHTKLMAISDKSQAIGEFLDNSEYHLCKWDPYEEEFVQVTANIQDVLAWYFEIDQDKLEQEKRAMLDEIRKANG